MNPVEQFYDADAHVEWERLNRHCTEFAVTMRALREFLPQAPAKILDVGGGPGRYAIALSQRGYSVTLVDLSEASLQRAAIHAAAAGVSLAGIFHGNATDLSSFADAAYDAVLMFGPFYHLIEPAAREAALHHAHRVLKPGGLIFVAFLTQFSALRVCAERFPTWLVENPAYVERILTTGIHQGEWGVTTAYHVHPDQIAPLMAAGGFAPLQIIACEGIVGQAEERINTLTGPSWEWWADLNYRLGKDPALYGAATHLLYIGCKA